MKKNKVYHSFQELALDYGIKPTKKRTTDEDKLKKQREKFLGTCKICNQPMKWINDTNIIACCNEKCKGVKHSYKNSKGEEITYYEPIVKMLNDKGREIAQNLFD